MTSMRLNAALACALIACAAAWVLSQTNVQPAKAGTVQRIKIHGKALEGNLEGETADPDVSIYLPPSYEMNKNRRYPVIYLLHGYGLTDQYWTGTGLGNTVRGVREHEAMDKDITSGIAREMNY